MKRTSFPTSQDAETAFYEAIEACDLEAMMEVWAEDEELVCVHPGGPRLQGYDQVRGSWAAIFSSGQRLKFELSDLVVTQGMIVAVHSLYENISPAEDRALRQRVATTNVFLRTASGWRMIAHHASPMSQVVVAPGTDTPQILH